MFSSSETSSRVDEADRCFDPFSAVKERGTVHPTRLATCSSGKGGGEHRVGHRDRLGALKLTTQTALDTLLTHGEWVSAPINELVEEDDDKERSITSPIFRPGPLAAAIDAEWGESGDHFAALVPHSPSARLDHRRLALASSAAQPQPPRGRRRRVIIVVGTHVQEAEPGRGRYQRNPRSQW